MKNFSLILGVFVSAASLTLLPAESRAESRDADFNSSWEKRQERAKKRAKSESRQNRVQQPFVITAPRRQYRERTRRPSFLESLFGAPSRRRYTRERYRLPNNEPLGADPILPEMPAFSAYQPDPLVALTVQGLGGEIVDETVARKIHTELSSPSQPVLRVERAERKAIVDFYKARKFAPAWVGEYGVSVRGKRVLDALSKAAADGLEPADYLPPSMLNFSDDPERFKGNEQALARLDVELTVKAVKFARNAYSGRIKPKRLSETLDVEPETLAAEKAIAALMKTVHPEEYLDGLHPTHPVYVMMKAELAKVGGNSQPSALPPVGPGPSMKLGLQDERVPLLRRHMEQLGFYSPDNTTAGAEGQSDTLYDQAMADAVREFQSAKGLYADGIAGPQTLGALSSKAPENRVAKLKANMERMRWLPKELGQRHIFVNQAAYQVRVVEDDNVIHQARVIVGKQRFPTPMFSDEMETVVFNPYWNVPRSIMKNEFLPKLWDDPGYLDRNGYEVINQRGQRVASYSVDWWNYYGDDVPYDIRQTPGRANALGEVKFLFPNKHAVYLHDTPTKNLFKKNSRAFSHGCVRVQNPRKFAEFILGWNKSQVDSAIHSGANQSVKLQTKIPVHLTYFTIWPDNDGRLRYRSDVYGRDEAVLLALKKTRIALR
ncbi:MAG: L,D-transpeptidase family protein [Hyphomicrobiales bacterium]